MKMTRRQAVMALGVGAGWSMARPPEPASAKMGLVIHSYGIRRAGPSGTARANFSNPLDFLDHCEKLGAGGMQIGLGKRPEAFAARLRDLAKKRGLYVEGIVSLPADAGDVKRFEEEVQTAKNAGAAVLRTVVLGERRYEKFNDLETYKAFVKRGKASLHLAEPVVARLDMKLAVENHKDWRIDELLGLMKQLESKHVGICLDTGNSIALLEDPMEVVRAYAPWTMTTHMKDMGVAEYPEGFLLAEVPLGEGILNLAAVVELLRKTKPEVKLNLEMITRDPLRVPCLTPKYWTTFERVPGRDLAATLTMVRKRAFPRPLPMVSNLERSEQVRLEDANVRESLNYAQVLLGA